MALKDDVESDIKKTVKTALSTTTRTSATDQSVPASEDLGYSEGVYLPATYLYADMADSSGLVSASPADTVARVMKAYLVVSTRIIRSHNGHIRSFDGDRVMGIFAGTDRFNRSVKAAMQIQWAMKEHVQPAISSQFKSIKDSGWKLNHGCGIASGQALLVRAGFRGNDDLVSVGDAPNLAAKLSDLRETYYKTFIGKGTYGSLTEPAITTDGVNMWTGPYDQKMGGRTFEYYKTNFYWKF